MAYFLGNGAKKKMIDHRRSERSSLLTCYRSHWRSQSLSHAWTQVRERRGIDEEEFLNGSNEKQSNDDFMIVEKRIVMTKTFRANQTKFLYDLCDLRSSSQTKL